MATPPPPPTSLFDLPPDMVRVILGHLGAAGLANIACTCKAGRAAAGEEELWAGLAARLAARVPLTREARPARPASVPPTAVDEAARVVGPLAAWAPAGVDSYRTLVLGLLHPCGWALQMPCTIPNFDGTSGLLGGLVSPRLVLPLPGNEVGGGLLWELCTPVTLGSGFDRTPMLLVKPGLPPSADRPPGGTRLWTLCLRTGRPTPGRVPMPGAHPARLTPFYHDVVSFSCDGGCSTALGLAQGRVGAATVEAAERIAATGAVPGGARGPPLRPGLPDYGNRQGGVADLIRTMGRMRLNPNDPGALVGSTLDLMPLRGLPGWGGPPPKPPRPPQPGTRSPGARLAHLEGLWKGCYGPHGPETLVLGPPEPEILESTNWSSAQVAPSLAAVKVGGDWNVPAGGVSFTVYPAADVRTAVERAAASQELDDVDALLARGMWAAAWATGARAEPAPGAPLPWAALGATLGGALHHDPSTPEGWDDLTVVAAHPAVGGLADAEYTRCREVDAVLLELGGWVGEAFVLVWGAEEGDGDVKQACMFVRVHENEVMG